MSVAIIGGGITGLSTAWYLEKAARNRRVDVSIVLVERENSLGGKISTANEAGFVIEGGPDGFLTRKPWAVELANEIGLTEDLVYTQTAKAFLLHGGRLHLIPPGLMGPAPARQRDVWRASFLSWRGKLRAAIEPHIGQRNTSERESLGGFLARRLGSELTDSLLEPLVAGIYGGNAYDTSLDALFPMLEQWERRYGSITRGMRESKKQSQGANQTKSAFFSFRTGTHQFVQAIAENLEDTEILAGRSVTRVECSESSLPPRYRNIIDENQTLVSDISVLATPAGNAGRIVESFAPDLAQLLRQMQHTAAGSVYLAFQREDVAHPLDGSGFLVPRAEAGLVTGCTWMSSKWPERSPENLVLLRAFLGRAKDNSFLELSEADLIKLATETLQPILGIRGTPKHAWVNRWQEGMPRYRIDHTDWLEDVERELSHFPGLFLCGASYRGIGVPDCVRQGRDTAERVIDFAANSIEQDSRQTIHV